MAENWGVQWGRLKIWLEEPGQGWADGVRIKRWFFCKLLWL